VGGGEGGKGVGRGERGREVRGEEVFLCASVCFPVTCPVISHRSGREGGEGSLHLACEVG
jgi:hypothetical protein